MALDNIDKLFEQIQQTNKSANIANFVQTDINYAKNPYTQDIYEARDLYKFGHNKGFTETRWLTESDIQANNLTLKPNEKDNFIESDLYQGNTCRENIKFYNVEQLDKASFDKLPPEIKPEPTWAKNPKIEKFIASQGAKVLHNSTSTPRYNIKTHTIHMPHQSQYSTAEKYYNDVFHELGHSTSRELGRIPKSPEQAASFFKRDELVAEISAMKLNEMTKNSVDKENNLTYLKHFLNEFGDDKGIQKTELSKALIESDKVVELTKNKYVKSISNEAFVNARQAATQKLESKQSLSPQKSLNQGMNKGIER